MAAVVVIVVAVMTAVIAVVAAVMAGVVAVVAGAAVVGDELARRVPATVRANAVPPTANAASTNTISAMRSFFMSSS